MQVSTAVLKLAVSDHHGPLDKVYNADEWRQVISILKVCWTDFPNLEMQCLKNKSYQSDCGTCAFLGILEKNQINLRFQTLSLCVFVLLQAQCTAPVHETMV